ncbi:hypothetical protein GCM10022243_18790 [Saccharothrix violaceirubra]|uniref:Immunity protein 21 of polymorphic toxin system n=1 Tax=Saccharothrix violaceirubra TaxID=413306 RepID=A0A7W7T284_9PSEU|nr:hypothetical protein [Saccharothrix violaceirubra]MBB4965214.1 hypothetical protein [Saccharothrix violaceirubra]
MTVAELEASTEIDVLVEHHWFGVGDPDSTEDTPIPDPGAWFAAGDSLVMFQSEEDIVRARLHLEWHTDRPPLDSAQWPHSTEIDLHLPSGVFTVDEGVAGVTGPVFTVPAGRYRARLGWRPAPPSTTEPEAYALVSFWPA